MDSFDSDLDPQGLPVPPFAVLYRSQQNDEVKPSIEAMFRDITAAHRYMNMYRSLEEHEFLTLEELDMETGGSTVHSALTAGTMRMVITEHGPRTMPKEIASLWGEVCDDPECDCHDEDKEGDDE